MTSKLKVDFLSAWVNSDNYRILVHFNMPLIQTKQHFILILALHISLPSLSHGKARQ
jgi:hypothetical protein